MNSVSENLLPDTDRGTQQPPCLAERLSAEVKLGAILQDKTGSAKVGGRPIGHEDRADDRGISFQNETAAIADQEHDAVESV